jgi:hypothetical protein
MLGNPSDLAPEGRTSSRSSVVVVAVVDDVASQHVVGDAIGTPEDTLKHTLHPPVDPDHSQSHLILLQARSKACSNPRPILLLLLLLVDHHRDHL